MIDAAGDQRIIGMVGENVGAAKSPEIFNAWFARHRPDLAMVRCEVTPDAFDGFIDDFRSDPSMIGLVLTMPHKATVVPMIDRHDASVERFGVANAVRKSEADMLEGAMFDGDAFHAVVEEAGFAIAGSCVAIVGCGAAGLACGWTALSAGAARVTCDDVDPNRSEALVDRLRGAFPSAEIGSHDARASDLIVNASPVGTNRDDPSPVASGRLAGARLVLDLAAGADTSRLIRDAEAAGIPTIDGRAFASAQFALLRDFLLENARG